MLHLSGHQPYLQGANVIKVFFTIVNVNSRVVRMCPGCGITYDHHSDDFRGTYDRHSDDSRQATFMMVWSLTIVKIYL